MDPIIILDSSLVTELHQPEMITIWGYGGQLERAIYIYVSLYHNLSKSNIFIFVSLAVFTCFIYSDPCCLMIFFS